MTLDLNKPMQLRRGNKVVFHRVIKDGTDMPLFIVYDNERGGEEVIWAALNGRTSSYSDRVEDEAIVNTPEFEYKLIYDDGVVIPATADEWFFGKDNFAGYDKCGRLGYLIRAKGEKKAVFEPI